jgi:hypothetical protein
MIRFAELDAHKWQWYQYTPFGWPVAVKRTEPQEAPTFELVGRAAYDLILHQSARSDIYDGLSRADVFMHQPEARPITLEKLAR